MCVQSISSLTLSSCDHGHGSCSARALTACVGSNATMKANVSLPTCSGPHRHHHAAHMHAQQHPEARLGADNTTCFVSAAVQCLRHAAELPLLLIPTLEADMLAARAEQATTSSAPSAVPLAPAAPLGSSAPATPSGSPHSLQQAQHSAPQGRDSTDVASVAQQRDSDPSGDSPQAPSTPQTSTPRSGAFSPPADSGQLSTDGLEDRASGPDAQLRHSGIAPLLPDGLPQTTPGRHGGPASGAASGPPPIGPRPSIKVPRAAKAAACSAGCLLCGDEGCHGGADPACT